MRGWLIPIILVVPALAAVATSWAYWTTPGSGAYGFSFEESLLTLRPSSVVERPGT